MKKQDVLNREQLSEAKAGDFSTEPEPFLVPCRYARTCRNYDPRLCRFPVSIEDNRVLSTCQGL